MGLDWVMICSVNQEGLLRLFYGLNQQYLHQMMGFHDGPRPGSVQIYSIFNGAVIWSSRVNCKWHQVVDYILGKYGWYWWNEIVEWLFKLYKLTNMNIIMEEKMRMATAKKWYDSNLQKIDFGKIQLQ